MAPPTQPQSFVKPGPVPEWQASLMGEDQQIMQGVGNQAIKEAQRQKDMQTQKNMLDMGDKLAETTKQDALRRFPQKLSNGQTVADYFPPKEFFVDKQGQFDGIEWSKRALLGAYEFGKDYGAEKAAGVKQSQGQERIDQGQQRVEQGQQRVDIQKDMQALREKTAGHKQDMDAIRNSISQLNASIRGGRLSSYISLRLTTLQKDVEAKIQDKTSDLNKANADLDVAKSGRMDENGARLPVDENDVANAQKLVEELKAQVSEWKQTKLHLPDVRALNPTGLPLSPKSAGKPLPPKGTSEWDVLKKQAIGAAGTDPAKIKQWLASQGYAE